jgi:hypothetical protein
LRVIADVLCERMIRKGIGYGLFTLGFIAIKVLSFTGVLPAGWSRATTLFIRIAVPIACMAAGLIVLGKRKRIPQNKAKQVIAAERGKT